MLEPLLKDVDAGRNLPDWAGLDALRAVLFYEYRSDYFQGGTTSGERRMRQVTSTIRQRFGELVPAADPPP
jgi:hypothetical protein